MGVTPYTFDYTTWVALFPELSGVVQAAAENYFIMATMYVRNDGRGPINDPVMQSTLLNMVTAHLATLFSPQSGNGMPTTGGSEVIPLVGRIANTSEGSVKVQVDMPDQQPNAAWWNQTKYGAAVWAMMKPFRTMRYMPPRRRVYNPPMRYWGWDAGI
jgi:hypothetical protein